MAGGISTTYHYDGPQVIAEYEDGTLVRKFIYGPGIDEPIIMIDVAASRKMVGLSSTSSLRESPPYNFYHRACPVLRVGHNKRVSASPKQRPLSKKLIKTPQISFLL